jgi:microcystin-dependent protein
MSEPYIGEIRMFGGNFAPVGWMFCAGQGLPISENDALFNLIGVAYGGDGQSTFNLPDLRGRVPMHQGNGYTLAEMSGTETVTLTTAQIPVHNHGALTTAKAGTSSTPSDTIFADTGPAGITNMTTYLPFDGNSGQQPLNPNMITQMGSNQPHDNMQPFLTVNFILSLYGIYPSQN